MANLDYPRHVHGPDGAYHVVGDAKACAEALSQGWSLVPVLTLMQAAAVLAAQMAAGEVAAPVPAPEPVEPVVVSIVEPEPDPGVAQPKKRGRPRKV